ncbi:MAG: hypothetical protein AAGK09_03755 [Planctomycetota bacterium]
MTHDSDTSAHSPEPPTDSTPTPPPDPSPQAAPERSEGAGHSPLQPPHASAPAPNGQRPAASAYLLLLTFTLGAALGLILSPLGLNDRLPEPLRSALRPVPAELAARRDALQADLDQRLVALRATGVSGIALDEHADERRAQPDWQQLTNEIDATRAARSLRLLAAAAWCLAVMIACTVIIHRRRAARRSVDDVWQWARHTAAVALGFCVANYAAGVIAT